MQETPEININAVLRETNFVFISSSALEVGITLKCATWIEANPILYVPYKVKNIKNN